MLSCSSETAYGASVTTEEDSQQQRAWIEIIEDEDWSGPLAELQSSVIDGHWNRVDNIMAVHSLNPRALAAHNALYASAMAGTKTLRKVERELIALVVSLENHCHY